MPLPVDAEKKNCTIFSMAKVTGIVDYHAGNIKSVERACRAVGAEYVISDNPRDLQNAARLIVPGVGEAAYAMRELKKTGFDSFIKDAAAAGVPLLGICLGAQVFFDFSEEGDVPCLGIIPGAIRLFSNKLKEQGLKIPHMGWNSISIASDNPLFAGIESGTDFYFVHSYYISAENPSDVTAWCDYGGVFAAAAGRNSVQALQFHPEKSGAPGIKILANFTDVALQKTEMSNA